MATVTIRYGVTNNITREFDSEMTVGQLLSDRSLLGALNAPEGCVALVGGTQLSSDTYLDDFSGETVTLEKQASCKA
tara:strand:+ start:524 stop:754 length:231 start_codon:yes stop_codon:yes gene_type:complete